MRLLFYLILFTLALPVYSQRTARFSIKDSVSRNFLDSVKVTLTSYCFRDGDSGRPRTRTQIYMVNKTFSKKIRGLCEWTVDFEKDGYIICQPSRSTPSGSRERVIYMRKIPTVKLKRVD